MAKGLDISKDSENRIGVAENMNIDDAISFQSLLEENSFSINILNRLKIQARVNGEKAYTALESKREKICKAAKALSRPRTKRQIDNTRYAEKYRLRTREYEKLLETELENKLQVNFKLSLACTTVSEEIMMMRSQANELEYFDKTTAHLSSKSLEPSWVTSTVAYPTTSFSFNSDLENGQTTIQTQVLAERQLNNGTTSDIISLCLDTLSFESLPKNNQSSSPELDHAEENSCFLL